MKILQRFVLVTVIPTFFLSLIFFVLLLQLVDVFSELNRYLSFEVPLGTVLYIQMLYLPKSIQFALPIALLFSYSYGMGILHAQNELISVFSSGVSLTRFVLPLLLVGALLGSMSFWFEDNLVIPTLREKNALSAQVLRYSVPGSTNEVIRFDDRGALVYSANRYVHAQRELIQPQVLFRSSLGELEYRLQAQKAQWNESTLQWVFTDAWKYTFVHDEPVQTEFFREFTHERLRKPPRDFLPARQNIDDMQLAEARELIEGMVSSGFLARRERTQYHERFSFALTPFIVGLLSVPLGGRFKKNILLMSLLVSLGFSVVFFVFRMLGGLFATLGYISPQVGAWAGVVVFAILGLILIRTSKT